MRTTCVRNVGLVLVGITFISFLFYNQVFESVVSSEIHPKRHLESVAVVPEFVPPLGKCLDFLQLI